MPERVRHLQQRLNNTWLRLLQPSSRLTDESERVRATSLALMTLIGVIVQMALVAGLLLAGQGSHVITWLIAASMLLTAVAYALSRTPRYRIGSGLVIGTLTGMAYVWTLSDPTQSDRVQLMALPLIATAHLLPLRMALLMAAFITTPLILLLLPDQPIMNGPMMLNLAFMTGIASLSYVGALSSRQIEAWLKKRGDELALSERKLRGVIEHSQDGVLLIDESGLVVEWNAGCERITGLARQTIIGRFIWDVIAAIQVDAETAGPHNTGWPDRDRAQTRLSELLTTGQGKWAWRTLENAFTTASGELRFVESILFPIPTSQGHMIGGILRDTTAQQHARQEIAQAAALLRATLDSTAEAILVLDKNRSIVTHNRQFLEMWRLPDHLQNIPNWQDRFAIIADQVCDPPAFAARVQELMTDLDSEVTDIIELRDGRVLERHARPYRINGASAGRVYSFLDVTARLQAERALRQSESRFATAFQTSPDAITITRMRDSRYVAVNDGFTALTGFSAQESVGRTSIELNFWTDIEARDRMIAGLAAAGEARDIETEFRMRDGRLRTGLLSARLIELEGEPCALSIVRDITERKLMEAHQLELALERERVTMLQQFISDASHDLLTPITILNTSVYLLNRYVTDDRQREHLDKLKVQIDRLTRMIRDMLTMSRLDKPIADEFDFVPADLVALVSRVVSDHRGLAESREQRLSFVAETFVPPLPLDSAKMSQVAANLIENALKYTPPGGHVNVSVGIRDGRAFLQVRDTGAGIAERDLPHIFKRFYRGKAHRPSEGGTGLGLSIVDKIVQAHSGSVDVESQLGQGTTFTVWLPLHSPASVQ